MCERGRGRESVCERETRSSYMMYCEISSDLSGVGVN